MLMHPPGRGDDLGIPSSAATHTRTAGLGDAERGDRFLRLMVLDDGGGCPVQLSMHIQVPLPAGIRTFIDSLIDMCLP